MESRTLKEDLVAVPVCAFCWREHSSSQHRAIERKELAERRAAEASPEPTQPFDPMLAIERRVVRRKFREYARQRAEARRIQRQADARVRRNQPARASANSRLPEVKP